MSNRDLANLALKVFAIWLFVQAIQLTPCSQQIAPGRMK